MIDRQLIAEMEQVKSLMKLTPEERKKEVTRKMYVELRAMEMERRQRVALENMEKLEREREERERATESLRRQREKNEEERMRREAEQREEEERRASEQKPLEKMIQEQLRKERLRWAEVMQVEKELTKRPRCISALKEEQQRRREEAELCRLQTAGGKASPERPTSDLKAEQQSGKKTLVNNWVGEQKQGSKSAKDKLPPNSTTSANPAHKSEEKPKKPKEILPCMQQKLRVGYWVEKCQNRIQKRAERRELKAEEHYARWTAFKESRTSSFTWQSDCYTASRSTAGRNSILRSNF